MMEHLTDLGQPVGGELVAGVTRRPEAPGFALSKPSRAQ